MSGHQASSYYESVSSQMWNGFPGIVIAGTAYTFVLALAAVVLDMVAGWSAAGSPGIAPLDAVAVTLIAVVVSAVSLAFIAFVGLIAMTIFNLTLNYAIPAPIAAAVVGGVCGFVLGALFTEATAYSKHSGIELAVRFLLGPILMTLACHVGGYYQVRWFQFLLAAEGVADRELSVEQLKVAMARFDDAALVSDCSMANEVRGNLDWSESSVKVHPLDEPDNQHEREGAAGDVDRQVVTPDSSSAGVQQNRKGLQWTLSQVFILTTWVGLFAAAGAAWPEIGFFILVFAAICGLVQLVSFGVLLVIRKRIDQRLCRLTLQFVNNHATDLM